MFVFAWYFCCKHASNEPKIYNKSLIGIIVRQAKKTAGVSFAGWCELSMELRASFLYCEALLHPLLTRILHFEFPNGLKRLRMLTRICSMDLYERHWKILEYRENQSSPREDFQRRQPIAAWPVWTPPLPSFSRGAILSTIPIGGTWYALEEFQAVMQIVGLAKMWKIDVSGSLARKRTGSPLTRWNCGRGVTKWQLKWHNFFAFLSWIKLEQVSLADL